MSSYIIPLVVALIVIYGLIKKIDLFDNFINGSTGSFKMMLTIFPNILAMVFSINILIASGFMDFIIVFIRPILKLPIEVISLALLRPISGNATLALLNNIYLKYGVDSLYGLMSSVIQGSTDTTFYVLALYYGSVGIKNIKYAPIASLFADFVGITSAIIISYIIF